MNRTLTVAELQSRTDVELQVLFRLVSEQMTQSPLGSPERRNGIATLENVASILHSRRTLRP